MKSARVKRFQVFSGAKEPGKTPGLVASFSPCPKTKESTLSEFSPQSVVRSLRTTDCGAKARNAGP